MTEEELGERLDRIGAWFAAHASVLLMRGGLAAFWAACLAGGRVPVEALAVGPGMMVLGAVLAETQKRRV